MTSTLLLRVASVISLLFACGHTLGGRRSWSPMGESDVLAAMRAFRFETMGVTRSYLDFYRGFGFTLSVFLLLQTVVLWQLGTLAKRNGGQERPMVWSFLIASLASTALTWRFIFPMPVYFWAAIIACLGGALALGEAGSSRPLRGTEVGASNRLRSTSV